MAKSHDMPLRRSISGCKSPRGGRKERAIMFNDKAEIGLLLTDVERVAWITIQPNGKANGAAALDLTFEVL